MIKKKIVCGSENGLHARPAALVAHAAKSMPDTVTVVNTENNKSANARSVTSLMCLAAKKGTILEVAADGADEKNSLEKISAMLSAENTEDIK